MRGLNLIPRSSNVEDDDGDQQVEVKEVLPEDPEAQRERELEEMMEALSKKERNAAKKKRELAKKRQLKVC